MTNTTEAWTWSGDFPYASSLASAEWIVEAPTSSGGISPLPNYNSVTFGGLTANGKNPNLLPPAGIVMHDPNGGAYSTPCTPNDGDEFVVVYGQSNNCPQNAKLVGSGISGPNPQQGWSVALSADGNTAIVGGPSDYSPGGAAWVFTRNGGVWRQQGAKLVGSGAVGQLSAEQGYSVALSADGNTALVGGPDDNSYTGAAWVFTRNGGVWTQQGSKLVGAGAVGQPGAQQGFSVALSADGATALVGGVGDTGDIGAAWVFTRSGGVWTQQGAKLVGAGAVGGAQQGVSVALSADGNTALVGGPDDNSYTGAAWVFTRNGGVWTQQGSKLVGAGAVGAAGQGSSVALSADGATAIVGGPGDNSQAGAAWVFTRNAGVWTQQGAKLVGAGAVDMGGVFQGESVALSADGTTAIVGGDNDNSGIGAAWVFTRNGGVWTQQGSKLVGAGAVGPETIQGYSVALSAEGATALVGGPADRWNTGSAWVFIAQSPAFTASPASGQAPLLVSFSSTVAGPVNFGDGTSGTLTMNPMPMNAAPKYVCGPVNPQCGRPTPSFSTSHTYTSPGAYTATLLDSKGAILASATITVTSGPTARATAIVPSGEGSRLATPFARGTVRREIPATGVNTAAPALMASSASNDPPQTTVTVTSPSDAADATASPTTGPTPLTVTFMLAPGSARGMFDFGDGSSRLVRCDFASSCVFTHTYATPGAFIAHAQEGAAVQGSATPP
jgi:PKD repeat protein